MTMMMNQVGEQRLLLAVLEDAVHTLQRYADASDSHGRRLFLDALAWFRSDETGSPFAFVTVCEALGLDAGYLRLGLRRWLDREVVSDRHIPWARRRSRAVEVSLRRVAAADASPMGRIARRHPAAG
jgi:hypothetical protein